MLNLFSGHRITYNLSGDIDLIHIEMIPNPDHFMFLCTAITIARAENDLIK